MLLFCVIFIVFYYFVYYFDIVIVGVVSDEVKGVLIEVVYGIDIIFLFY